MQYDIILITGDTYFDHPMNGAAVIRRLLENKGYSVAVIDQPDWRRKESFSKFGKPRLFFAVSSGCMDSMLANYTPMKRKREHAYLPDRAVIVYCGKIRELYKDSIIAIAGNEAGARRFAHYDYWDNRLRRSILLDSRADILIYGMAERQVLEIAGRISEGKDLKGIRGTAIREKSVDAYKGIVMLPSFEDAVRSKERFAESFVLQRKNRDCFTGKALAEPYRDCYIVQNPPALPLTTEELDFVYSLPYARELPKQFRNDEMMQTLQFSVVTHRGCFGGCSFCSIGFLQGSRIQSRSKESILDEIRMLSKRKDFKGIIYDLGGPTANMYGMQCRAKGNAVDYISIKDGRAREMHSRKQCIKDCLPGPCGNLDRSHASLTELLSEARKIPGVKKVFVRSGVRYDLIDDDNYLREMVEHHISGQLKVAPEHVNERVLKLMNKPSIKSFEQFKHKYEQLNRKLGMKQYLVPYLVVAHPGCGMREAKELADYVRRNRIAIEQSQVFTPTPMTLATCMYHTGMNPFTKEKVYVPYSYKEKKMQKAMLYQKI